MAVFKPVKTPCIGVCSTGIGDSVCRGCKRFAHEVIDWNAYTNEQRLIIARRLQAFLARVVRNHVEIVDQERLLEQMRHQQIRFQPEQDPHCWVFELLRAGARQINAPQEFGLRILPPWKDTPLSEIRDLIDREHYQLSCAYYQRYVVPGLDYDALTEQR